MSPPAREETPQLNRQKGKHVTLPDTQQSSDEQKVAAEGKAAKEEAAREKEKGKGKGKNKDKDRTDSKKTIREIVGAAVEEAGDTVKKVVEQAKTFKRKRPHSQKSIQRSKAK
jgi:hypothetical protein